MDMPLGTPCILPSSKGNGAILFGRVTNTKPATKADGRVSVQQVVQDRPCGVVSVTSAELEAGNKAFMELAEQLVGLDIIISRDDDDPYTPLSKGKVCSSSYVFFFVRTFTPASRMFWTGTVDHLDHLDLCAKWFPFAVKFQVTTPEDSICYYTFDGVSVHVWYHHLGIEFESPLTGENSRELERTRENSN